MVRSIGTDMHCCLVQFLRITYLQHTDILNRKFVSQMQKLSLSVRHQTKLLLFGRNLAVRYYVSTVRIRWLRAVV